MTLDVVMADGDDYGLLKQVSGAASPGNVSDPILHVSEDLLMSNSPSHALHSGVSVTPYGLGGSPTKYVSPRLRGSPSLTSPTMLAHSRSLAADTAPTWRSNLLFGETSNTGATFSSGTTSNPSPRSQVSGTIGLSGDISVIAVEGVVDPNVVPGVGYVGGSFGDKVATAGSSGPT
ncbi:unnamed protein product [Calypogeia fissa]